MKCCEPYTRQTRSELHNEQGRYCRSQLIPATVVDVIDVVGHVIDVVGDVVGDVIDVVRDVVEM